MFLSRRLLKVAVLFSDKKSLPDGRLFNNGVITATAKYPQRTQEQFAQFLQHGQTVDTQFFVINHDHHFIKASTGSRSSASWTSASWRNDLPQSTAPLVT